VAQTTLADQARSLVGGSPTAMDLSANNWETKLLEALAAIEHKPTEVQLSGDGTVINGANGMVVGSLTTIDRDAGETHGYALSGTDADKFELVGGQLKLKDSETTDYATQQAYSLIVTSTGDNDSLAVDQALTIAVDNPAVENNASTIRPFSFESEVIKASELELRFDQGGYSNLSANEDIVKLTLNVDMAGISHSDLSHIGSIAGAELDFGIDWDKFEALGTDGSKYGFDAIIGEAFIDDNNNFLKDVSEAYIDDNDNAQWDAVTNASMVSAVDNSGIFDEIFVSNFSSLKVVDSDDATANIKSNVSLATIYLNPIDDLPTIDVSLGGMVIADNPGDLYEFVQSDITETIATSNQIEAKISSHEQILDGSGNGTNVFDDKLLDDFALELWADNQSLGQSIDVIDGKIEVPGDSRINFDAIKLSDPSVYDSRLDIKDVMLVLKDIVNISMLTGAAKEAGDVDNSNSIDILDVMAMLKDIVGIKTIDTFDLVETDEHGAVTRLIYLDNDNPVNPPELTLIANGDVNFDGGFKDDNIL
jgi:hypothetical protein